MKKLLFLLFAISITLPAAAQTAGKSVVITPPQLNELPVEATSVRLAYMLPDSTLVTIAQAQIRDKAFTMTLSAAPDSRLLTQVSEVPADGKSVKINISEPGTMIMIPNIPMLMAYDDAGGQRGYGICMDYSILRMSFSTLSWCYADRDCTISGSMKGGGAKITYNMKLRRGWNRILMTGSLSKRATITTEFTPADIKDFKWLYINPDAMPE
jgi:hypothetical protein